MNVLIVDDEIPAIEGTLSAVDWSKFGFRQIYTAYSMSDALKIYNVHPVDIMICDIEMPKGSGIELLRWVKTHHPNTEAIFLTAHADFEYAKQAVKLGCLDYVLKPVIPDELELILDKAVHKVNQNKETMKYRQYGQFWLQNKPLVIERFWLDILNCSIPADPKAIMKVAKERSIPYCEKAIILPILIRVQRWYKTFDLRDEKLLELSLRNAAEKTIREINPDTFVIPVNRGMLLAILDVTKNSTDIAALKTILESYIASSNQNSYCDLSLYIGNTTSIAGLSAMMDYLHTIDRNNVTATNKVILPVKDIPKSIRVKLPDFKIWSKMMVEGLKEPLLQEVKRYQCFLGNESGIDAQFLIQFHQDFLQMVHYVLQIKGIQAHQLFNDAQSLEMSLQAVRTIMDLFTWVFHVIDKAFAYMIDVEKSNSIMDKVKRYITQHIEDELTREEIANHVFLNPDYLTRIVKKETGLPVSEYIQRQRMELAKDLLVKTDMPVSRIAMQVGYKHFSQFSKIFRKHTDMNPVDYRRYHKSEAK